MILWAFAGNALAHEFSIVVVGPSPTWCDEIAERAAPADVVQLEPGTYPGGCELALGGLVDLNEALLVSPASADAPVIIEADPDGLALRITGEPTRLLGLTVRGRVEIAADNVTIDTCTVDGLALDPGVERVTVLFSDLPEVVADLEHAVVRGNRLDTVDVRATTGLVADNAVQGHAFSTLPFHRNLVGGDLRATGDAFANVLVGAAEVDGRFWGNTALGPVLAGDPRNTLTAEADLPTEAGNVRCPECLRDPARLDVRLQGSALDAPFVPLDEDVLDFCGQPRTAVGAVGPLIALEGLPWTAWDRVRTGCIPGEPPPDPPLEPLEPYIEDLHVQPRRSCAVGPAGTTPWALMVLPLLRRRPPCPCS